VGLVKEAESKRPDHSVGTTPAYGRPFVNPSAGFILNPSDLASGSWAVNIFKLPTATANCQLLLPLLLSPLGVLGAPEARPKAGLAVHFFSLLCALRALCGFFLFVFSSLAPWRFTYFFSPFTLRPIRPGLDGFLSSWLTTEGCPPFPLALRRGGDTQCRG